MYFDRVKQQIKALKLALPDELLGCKIYSYCEGTKQTSFTKSHERFSDFLETEVKIHAQYLYLEVST